MKRSEALNIIWEAINELEDADHILTRLEKAGMSPPECRISEYFITEKGTSDSVTYWARKWEPENE